CSCPPVSTPAAVVGFVSMLFVFLPSYLVFVSDVLRFTGTPFAEAPKNEFAFPQDAFAERCWGGLGNVVPFQILHVAAAVANEVMMLHASHVESGGAALHGDFAH